MQLHSASPTTPEVEALEPLVGWVRAITTLLVVLLALTGVAMAFGDGSFFGWGEFTLCVNAADHIPLTSDSSAQVWGLQHGATASVHSASLCSAAHPGVGLHLLVMLRSLPSALVLLGFLLLFWRLARHGRRAGVFTARFGRGVRALGWFLVAGTLVAATVQSVATAAVVGRLVHGQGVGDFMTYWHVSIPVLLGGVACLTFGRLLQIGGAMRTELDLTV